MKLWNSQRLVRIGKNQKVTQLSVVTIHDLGNIRLFKSECIHCNILVWPIKMKAIFNINTRIYNKRKTISEFPSLALDTASRLETRLSGFCACLGSMTGRGNRQLKPHKWSIYVIILRDFKQLSSVWFWNYYFVFTNIIFSN